MPAGKCQCVIHGFLVEFVGLVSTSCLSGREIHHFNSECLLCGRHHSTHWGYNGEDRGSLCPPVAGHSKEEGVNEEADKLLSIAISAMKVGRTSLDLIPSAVRCHWRI